jgi:hypothetical protein
MNIIDLLFLFILMQNMIKFHLIIYQYLINVDEIKLLTFMNTNILYFMNFKFKLIIIGKKQNCKTKIN